jgi:hypothetical protein
MMKPLLIQLGGGRRAFLRFLQPLQRYFNRIAKLFSSGWAAPKPPAAKKLYVDPITWRWDQNARSQFYLNGSVHGPVGCDYVKVDNWGYAASILVWGRLGSSVVIGSAKLSLLSCDFAETTT